MMKASEKRSDPTALRVQPFVEVCQREACPDLFELPRRGGRQGVSDVLDKPSLEERGQGFRGRWTLELQGILLAVIEDQERVFRYQVPPLGCRIECRSARHGLERQGRAVLFNTIALCNPIQQGRASGQVPEGRVEPKLEGTHVQTVVRRLWGL